MDGTNSKKSDGHEAPKPSEGRRKLLRAAVYVAPAVIGTLVTKRAEAAGGICTPYQPPPSCSCAPAKLINPSCP
jgi:hypothetical protein